MIKIPGAEGGQLPDVRMPEGAPLDAFGGGEAVARSFGAASALAGQVKQEAQQRLEEGIRTEVQNNVNQLVQAETDQKIALQKVKGKDALGASVQAVKDFDKLHQDIQKNSPNPIVQKATAEHFNHVRGNLYAWGEQYANAEHKRYMDDTDQATVESERDAAIADGTPQRIAQALDAQGIAMNALGKRNGWDEKQIALETAKARSATHAGVVEMMLAGGNDFGAKTYFEANKGALVGRDLARLTRMVKSESTLGEAQRQVDRIFSTYYNTVEGEVGSTTTAHYAPETEEAAMDEARKIEDPDVRAKAEELTRQRWSGIMRSREEKHKADMVQAANDIDSGKTFDQLDAALKDRLSPTDRKTLKTYAKGEVVTNQKTWYTLNLMASAEETREKFKKLNLTKYLDELSKADFQEVSKLQTGLIKDDAKAKKEADGFRGTATIVNGTIGGPKPKVPVEDHEQFMRVINEQVRQWKIDNKKDSIPDKEVERMTDDLLRTRRNVLFSIGGMDFTWGETPKYKAYGDFYDQYKMMPEEAKKQYVAQKTMFMLNDIPKTDREFIESQFKARGLTYSGVDVVDAYSKLKADRMKKAAPDAGK